MKYTDALTKTRLRCAVALVVTVWVLIIGAEWGIAGADTPPAHPPHAIAAGPGGHFAVPTDHHHLSDGSMPSAPEAFAAAVLPRITTVLAALTLVAALCVLAAWAWRVVAPAVRGPPGTLPGILTGQQLLTRLCVARR